MPRRRRRPTRSRPSCARKRRCGRDWFATRARRSNKSGSDPDFVWHALCKQQEAMGSVLYLHRGLQRKEAQVPEAKLRPESLLRPGYNCYAVARAERVALIVDAEAYFRLFYQAALRARRSITILGWDFNSQTQLHFDPVPEGAPPALLGEFLNYLVRRRRGLHVNVLNWDYP